jgi:ABC-2 type transport system ATP-binding protein
VTAVLRTQALGKRYGQKWALTNCTLSIPAGYSVGLVGPNGAGKTTLLRLAVGMMVPTAGTIEVLGSRPGSTRAQLARVGFVAQNTPAYGGLSVRDHLTLGARMNPGWDSELANSRIQQLGLDLRQQAGRLSGGQRAQLALTLAVAKRPELLILDEPVASLDPLARRNFLDSLAELSAGRQLSVVLSSHLLSDLERSCDYLIVLVASQVQLAGPVSRLLASHYEAATDRADLAAAPPGGWRVVSASQTGPRTRLLVQADTPIAEPGWTISLPTLEDLALAYMSRALPSARHPELEIQP